MDFSRLFDLPHYQLLRYPQKQSVSGIRDGEWFTYSTGQLIEAINQISAGLYALGLRPGQRVAIFAAHGTPYWTVADLALMQIGVVVVPIHPTARPDTIAQIMADSQAVACWVSDPVMLHTFTSAETNVSTYFLFPSAHWPSQFAQTTVHTWEQLIALGSQTDAAELDKLTQSITPDQLATILYTSGTSGEPKGVMLTHHNLVSNIKSTLAVIPLSSEHRVLSFLPLSHVMERMVTYTYLAAGASVWYVDQLDNLPRIFRTVRPHFFTAVPRIIERMHARMLERRDQSYPILRPVFDWALELGMRYPSRGGLRFSPWHRLRFWVADTLFFHHIRRSLGGHVQGIIVGAAALDQSLARLFTSAGIPIREGYGLTETSPVLTLNRFEPGGIKFGTVGMAVPGVEIRIADPDAEGKGEIQARGPNVMQGYLGKPTETAERFTADGWLRTGDQGKWEDRHFLRITGRLSEIFKTASGKFISPTKIEQALIGSRHIGQCMILGLNRPHVGALIVPDFEALQAWCLANKVHWTSPQYMVHNPKIERLLRAEIDQVNTHLEQAEKVRSYALLYTPWTPESGELTPTLKMRRAVIEAANVEVIGGMYQKVWPSQTE
jgi:long-chain acyl-CoA synthetase